MKCKWESDLMTMMSILSPLSDFDAWVRMHHNPNHNCIPYTVDNLDIPGSKSHLDFHPTGGQWRTKFYFWNRSWSVWSSGGCPWLMSRIFGRFFTPPPSHTYITERLYKSHNYVTDHRTPSDPSSPLECDVIYGTSPRLKSWKTFWQLYSNPGPNNQQSIT